MLELFSMLGSAYYARNYAGQPYSVCIVSGQTETADATL